MCVHLCFVSDRYFCVDVAVPVGRTGVRRLFELQDSQFGAERLPVFVRQADVGSRRYRLCRPVPANLAGVPASVFHRKGEFFALDGMFISLIVGKSVTILLKIP